MFQISLSLFMILYISFAWSGASEAKVVQASASHFSLQHQAHSEHSVENVWQRLIQPSTWWSSDHTYSGNASNLSLEPKAGGLWQEIWQGNSVLHGQVLYIKTNDTLRLNAPLGPMQGLALECIWTIYIEAEGQGTKINFSFIANGSEHSNLSELAPAVDKIMRAGLDSLALLDTATAQ